MLSAQAPVFTGTTMRNAPTAELKQVFTEAEVYLLPTTEIDALAQSGRGQAVDFRLQLGERDWSVEIIPADVRAANYVVRTSDGRVIPHEQKVKTFAGYLTDAPATDVRLTIDDDFLYGYVDNEQGATYIEPLRHFDADAPANAYVVYEELDVIPNSGISCAALETGERLPDPDPHTDAQNRSMVACKELELAIASDYSMYQKYNGVAGTENHNLGVMNNVNGDYSSAFVHQISFAIVEQFISTCSNCDPWTSSTNSSQVLQSFTNWGPNGFSQNHDLGQFWTNRNFNGSTIGVAWLGVVCSSYRYHVLQDFSNSAAGLRVMTSHEIGHNFDAGHDSGSGYIMSPSVGNVTAWSGQSINSINAHINAKISCFSNCGSGGGGGGGGGSSNPPVADFTANQTSGCAPLTVQFSDQSTGTVTSRSWSFPGGTPAFSNLQNPTVVYPAQGNFTVSLTVANADGSDVETRTDYIDVNCNTSNPPVADFTATPTQGCAPLTVQFTSTSTGPVGSYHWSFPGGSPATSSQPNPTVVYGSQGTYSATLTVSNADGTDAKIRNGYIDVNCSTQTPPNASFTATPTQGCAPLTVFYHDTSTGGVTSRQWSFPGGTPSSASGQYVNVTYEDMGQYTASLTVSNDSGTDTETKAGYIDVDCEVLPDAPVADFTADITQGCAPMMVQFTSQSTGDDLSYQWTFPGGFPASSNEANPTVSYQNPGDFNVTLTVSNPGGTDTEYESQFISVSDGTATADFNYTTSGYTVSFNNLSTNTTNYVWTFGDGSSSTQANPTYTYSSPGFYNITLTAYGNCGQATKVRQISFGAAPIANFSSDVTAGCAPLTVQYYDLSTGNISGRTWDFPGGTPSTSTDPNPVVTYSSPATYNVTLSVYGPNGNDSEYRNAYVYAGTAPTTYFQQTISGSTVSFNNLSNNAIDYAWDFGDGNTSTEEDPVHTYATPGQYTVTLYASNTCSGGVYYRTILIATTPTAAFTADQRSGCAPLTVQFTDQSTDFPTSWQWSFPGGDPATSSLQNPQVVYDTPGFYEVSLTATNTEGSTTETKAGYIVVGDVPTSEFTATLANGSTVTFSNTSSNADTYLWDFGDGNTSTEIEPIHSYATPGSYTVTLSATNNCGSVSSTQNVTAVAPPSAGFVADPNSGCAPMSVQFTDTSTGSPTSWQWNFPGGWPASSTQQNPTVNYNSAGIYDVSLTVSNAAGSNTFTFTEYIGVAAGPQPGFSYAGSDLTIQFSNFSNNAQAYFWDFGDGSTSTEANPVHTYAADGDYIVKLSATNNCGTFTATQLVTIATPPVAAFDADQTTGCSPLAVQFTSNSSDNTQDVQWFFPGGSPASSTAASPTITYAAAGTYDVMLIASNTAADDTLTLSNYISVESAPVAFFNTTTNGATASFDNLSNNATGYVWDFGDGTTSTDANPNHTYTSNGIFTVTLSATNVCGTTIYTEDISILTAPLADFTALSTQGCGPLTVIFNNQSSDNATNFQWNFAGGDPTTSTEENPTVVYSTPGTYAVSLTATNAAGSDEEVKTGFITVHPELIAGFDFVRTGATASFTSTSTNAVNYSWNFGNGLSSTEPNPTITYDADGTYAVSMTATGLCGTETVTQAVQVVTVPTADFVLSDTEGCGPLTVTFTNTSSSNVTDFLWTFENGDPATSTEENPTVSFAQAGSFDVTLEVSNSEGSDSKSIQNAVTVLPETTADFSYSQNGTTVSFNNDSQNATAYQWDFGNGTTSTETDPTISFLSDGTYPVSLTATGICGSETTSQTVEIVTQPVAAFTASVTEGCDPLMVDFTYTGSANVDSYLWTFENATPATSTDAHPSVSFSGVGEHTVTLVVGNAAGNSTLSIEDMITILPETTAGFDFSISGNTVDFSNESQHATSYNWNFGNGETSDEANPSITYDTDGTYTVSLTATGSCGTETLTQSITISTQPTAGFTASVTSGCGPLTVTFNNTSSSNATDFQWTFENGTPATSTEAGPTVNFPTAGSFDVTLVASNASGSDTYTLTDLIEVLPNTVADFTFVRNGMEVNFVSTAANATALLWDFGNGQTSTESNPNVTYAADGTYTVTLTATGSCGDDVSTQSVEISTLPLANFSADQTEGCGPLVVQFDNLSSANATDFVWTFPGGTPATSTNQNPAVTYATPGTYAVTLEASNDEGSDVQTQTGYITVLPEVSAAFDYSMTGRTLGFNDLSQFATNLFWDFGDGSTSTATNPQHTYAADGTYTVVLTTTNDCGSETSSQEITISTLPTAGFSADEPTGGCTPLTVSFTNSSDNAESYFWDFGNGQTSTEAAPSVVFTSAGSFDVMLIVSNAAGSDTLVLDQLVNTESTPITSFSAVANGQNVIFTNNSTNADQYYWNFGDGTTSTEANPTHTYAQDGSYTVVLTSVNGCGNVSFQQNVSVSTAPVAGFSSTNGTEGCSPFVTAFSNESSANAESFEWHFEGGFPATSFVWDPSVSYTQPGSYDVMLIASNAAGSDTLLLEDHIIIGEVPTVDFSYNIDGNLVNFSSMLNNFDNIGWDFGDGGSSDDLDPQHFYAADGTYTVVLSATNDCGTVTATYELTISTTLPGAGFGADATSICTDQSVLFANLSANAESYAWTFEGGQPMTSTDESPSVQYPIPGNYDVTLIAYDNTGNTDTLTLTDYIQVGTETIADFAVVNSGWTIEFNNLSIAADSFLWHFGDGTTTTEQHPSYTYTLPDLYDVTLIAYNACGADTTTQEIEVVGSQPLAAFAAQNREGCAPLTVDFQDLTVGTPSSWLWTFTSDTDTLISTEQHPSVVFTEPGDYNVLLVATNVLGSNSLMASSYVEVKGAPQLAFDYTANGTTISFENQSEYADEVLWYFGDGNLSILQNPVYTYQQEGTYEVVLAGLNECGADSLVTEIVISTTGTETPDFAEELSVFPNPNRGKFTLRMQGLGTSEELTLRLVDQLGRVHYEDLVDYRSGRLEQQFDFPNLPSGVYLLQIESSEGSVWQRVMIE